MICIFDAGSSRVIRAIHVKGRISSMHVVDSALEVLNLPGSLRCFDGILAIGTLGGDVLLIDICRQICTDPEQFRDEVSPCQIEIIPPHKITKVEQYKERCIKEGNHLAIHLNIVLDSKTEHFTLKGPQNQNKLFVNKEEVSVSKLYYCSQLTSFLVGFNFGAFQLWDLTTLSLVYTSPVCEDHLPITQFALLEPTDDPRAFCYLWVSYSNIEMFQGGLPFAVMYSFCYGSKEHHEGYGYLYQNFQFCTVRFQIELGALNANSKVKGGYCLNFEPVYRQQNNKDYLTKSASDVLALTKISWTVWFDRGETQTNMLVFDLNQWYKEQMPTFSSWRESSNYILKTSITDLISMTGHKSSSLLDVKIITKSLNQFLGVQKLEEHFFPTALSFDVHVLRENDVMIVHNDSLQKALLSRIESAGPLCLVRPNDVYQQILHLGLTPLFVDLQVNTSTSTESQREIILDVGLEHHLTGWLCKCASEWANGSFCSAGCSLDFLLNWAFYRAVTLKTTCDKYCNSLFDYSQLPLDSNTSILLNSCTRQINNLCTFYTFVLGKLQNYLTLPDVVEEQASSLNMVSIYFEVLVWMVNVGLLPECHQSMYSNVDTTEKIKAPYPVAELTKYYNERRAQLRLLSKDTFASSDQLLFIDNLISIKCGAEQLQKQWQDDRGSGLYPPPSLQSLLRSYLVPETNLLYKHTLVIYVFLDLAMTLDQTKYSAVITHLIKFPAVFKVPPSLIKITQAFWQLDHGEFASAMELMLDPQISNNDLQPWQHNIAMRALLLQDQKNLALFYMQVRKPPINNEKDVLTAISLFVANNMLDEAFYFKNQHNSVNVQMLLQHLFKECNKNGSLRNILYKHLNSEEEKVFFNYLKSVNNPNFEDLQVFYYLLRARFIEAFDVHTNIKKRNPDSLGLTGQKNASVSDHVVRIFKKHLPDVSKNLVNYVRKERSSVWTKLARPTPLSVFVHDNNEQIQYKSTVIHAALSKAKSTFMDDKLNLTTEETPFLRTPTALRRKSKLATTLVTPHVIDYEEECHSPAKRLKLSPIRSSLSSIHNQSMHSKMLTPIVKRNTSIDQELRLDATPHSILKVKSQEDALSQTFDDVPRSNDSRIIPINSRMSVQNTSKKIHVQFDDTTRFSTSLTSSSNPLSDSPGIESICIEDKLIQEAEQRRLSSISSKDVSLMVSSNESSGSDSYYSPSSSLEENVNKHRKTVIKMPGPVMIEHQESRSADAKKDRESEIKESISISEEHEVMKKDLAINESKTLPQSPRPRRSYKRSKDDSPSLEPRRTRASSIEKSHIESPLPEPRRTRRASSVDKSLKRESSIINASINISSESSSTSVSESPKQSPRLLQKINRRRPLSRQVLEHNAFSALHSSKIESKEVTFEKKETTVITETSVDSTKIISIESESRVSDITSDGRSRYRLIDSASKERRIERLGEDSGKNDSFLSELADEWFEDRSGNTDPEGVTHKGDFEGNEVSEEKERADVDQDCTGEIESGKGDMNSECSNEKEWSINAAQEATPSQLMAELQEFIVPRTSDGHTPMEVEEDKPEFLSMVATEAMNYIIEKRKEKESKGKPEKIKQDTLEKNIDIKKAPEQSVGRSTEAVFIETVEIKPVCDNTCYTVSELDKAFLKSEVYTDLSSSSEVGDDSCDRLEVVFETNIGNVAQNAPLEVCLKSSETCNDQPIDEALNEAYVDIKESEVYQDLSSDSEDIQNPLSEPRIVSDAFNELEDAVFESTLESALPKEVCVTERAGYVDNDVISISDENEENSSRTTSTSESDSNEYSADGDKSVDIVDLEPAQEKSLKTEETIANIEKMDSSPVQSSLSQNHEDRKIETELKVITELDHAEGKNLPKNVTEDEASKSTKIHETVECQPTDVSYSKDKTAMANQTRTKHSKPVEEDTDEKVLKETTAALKKHSKENTELSQTVTTTESLEQSDIAYNDTADGGTATPSKARTLKCRLDEHTSSSDTTDGDAVKELLVTAEVHSPSSKKKTQEPLLKRVTRRNSALLAQSEVDPKELPSTSKQSEDVQKEKKPASRNTRSTSFTEGQTKPGRRSTRSNSVGTSGIESQRKGKRRTISVDELPVIAEDFELGKTKSTVDRYTSTRRLTRKQANMLKNAHIPERGEMEKLEEGEPFDPMDLLDKEPFQGKPDSEEDQVYQTSSPTGSTVGSFKPGKRMTRSASAASDTSVAQSSQPSTPKRRRSKSQAPSPVKSTASVKTRLRKRSDSNSVASERSSPSPSKRSRKKVETDALTPTRKTTRSRTSSIGSAKSDGHTKRK
nr:unnamed protein product [Callosobruchus chinensis]